MSKSFDCDLLVVGLGPVGDVMTALARLHGLSVIGIDKSLAPFPLPRAAVFDHEIMRIFQMIGVAERIVPLCRVRDRYRFRSAQGETLLDFPVAPVGSFGWAETYALDQPAVEQVLHDRLAELGVPVQMGVTFDGLVQDASGADVAVSDASGSRTIRARYVVGCDGSRSAVRDALGVKLDDLCFDEPWLVLDTIIDDPTGVPVVWEQICDPKRPTTHMAMSGKRFRWEFMLKPGESPEEMLSEAKIRALLAPWDFADRVQIERKAVYRFHALVADRWQAGRVFIAGDAAHQMPPFAGQGMCSGIRDAGNLIWKIAAFVQGRANEGILKTYQEEREPHVRAIIGTAIAMGKVVCMLDEEAAAARDRDMLARKASGAQDVSHAYPDLTGGLLSRTPRAGALLPQPVSETGARLDEVLGIQPVLIGRGLPDAADPDLCQLDLDDHVLAPFAPAIAAWLHELGAAAVLVRPDRHVFGTGDPKRLLQLWRGALELDAQLDREATEEARRSGTQTTTDLACCSPVVSALSVAERSTEPSITLPSPV